MDEGKNIIQEYQQADFEKRLNMFLAYPCLRPQFSEIDDWEMPAICPGFFKSRQKTFKVSGLFGFIPSWVNGLLGKCCCLSGNK